MTHDPSYFTHNANRESNSRRISEEWPVVDFRPYKREESYVVEEALRPGDQLQFINDYIAAGGSIT